MQHIENQNQFTLDSDDELSEGVKEEDNVQKAGVVELTVNGHGSHW